MEYWAHLEIGNHCKEALTNFNELTMIEFNRKKKKENKTKTNDDYVLPFTWLLCKICVQYKLPAFKFKNWIFFIKKNGYFFLIFFWKKFTSGYWYCLCTFVGCFWRLERKWMPILHWISVPYFVDVQNDI